MSSAGELLGRVPQALTGATLNEFAKSHIGVGAVGDWVNKLDGATVVSYEILEHSGGLISIILGIAGSKETRGFYTSLTADLFTVTE